VRFFERALAIVEERGLLVVLGELLGLTSHLVVVNRLAKRSEANAAGLERATTGERVGLVGDAAPIDDLPVHAVPLIVVRLRDWRVDRNFVEVRPAQT
jgi:hypothetical protein